MGIAFVRGCGVAFVRPRDTTVPEVGRAREPFVRPFSTTIPNHNTTPLIYIFFHPLIPNCMNAYRDEIKRVQAEAVAQMEREV